MKFFWSIFNGILLMIGGIAFLFEVLIRSFFMLLFGALGIVVLYFSIDYYKEGQWLKGLGTDLFGLVILSFVLVSVWSHYDDWKESRQYNKEHGL